MTSTQPLTASERHARIVLSAWNKREFAELETILTELSLKRPRNLPAAESERLDLLQDLGRDLLLCFGPVANGADQDAALSLVRHLARCE